MKNVFFSTVLLCMPLLLTAQVKLKSGSGKVVLGNEGTTPLNSEATVSVYSTGAGTYPKLSFGQLTKYSNGGYKGPFIGEWGGNGVYHGERLWINGGKGLYITTETVPDNASFSTPGILLYYDTAVPTGLIHVLNSTRFDGQVYSNGILLTSDERLKTDVKAIESPLGKLQQLQGINYRLLKKSEENQPESFEETNADEQFNRERLGFMAQELEKVFPNLVETDAEGYKSVDYIGLIPVIVEALKEQQQELKEQQQAMKDQSAIIAAQSEKIKELESKLEGVTGETPIARTAYATETPLSADEAAAVTNAFLYQNAPNPFNTVTIIRYFLPTETGNATLYIFDLQGRMIESYTLNGAGEGQVQISASGLQPGMYIYSLLINGKEIDTKRMVITQ